MRKNSFYVRFRRVDAIVPAADWSEWIGPVIAPGPFVAAKQIVLAEDWTSLPVSLRAQVYDDLRDYEYDIVVSAVSRTVVRSFIVMRPISPL